MIKELFKIFYLILKLDRNFFKDKKNFGEASIYFALLIILISSLVSLVPNIAFTDYLSYNFNLGEIKGPTLRSVIFIGLIVWIVKVSYLYFIGVVIFPSTNTKCDYRKIMILVAYCNVPLILNIIIFDKSLLFFMFINYIWYNVSLIVGLNIVLNYKNIFKAIIICLLPLFIFFIYVASVLGGTKLVIS